MTTPDFWLERRGDDGVFTPGSDAARAALTDKADTHAAGRWRTDGPSVIVPESGVEPIVTSLLAAGWAFAFASGAQRES